MARPAGRPSPMDISRRSWAIICARISSDGGSAGGACAVGPAGGGTAAAAPAPGGTANVPVAGAAATVIVAGAAPLPGNLTTVWHFGHFTLKGRSGTFASSMTMRCEQFGQLACTGLPFDQVVQLG